MDNAIKGGVNSVDSNGDKIIAKDEIIKLLTDEDTARNAINTLSDNYGPQAGEILKHQITTARALYGSACASMDPKEMDYQVARFEQSTNDKLGVLRLVASSGLAGSLGNFAISQVNDAVGTTLPLLTENGKSTLSEALYTVNEELPKRVEIPGSEACGVITSSPNPALHIETHNLGGLGSPSGVGTSRAAKILDINRN